MAEIHIGNKIKQVLEKKGMSVSEFARRINKSRENVYSIYKRKTIDTGLLVLISEVLEQDFFSNYTKMAKTIQDLRDENQNLRDTIKHLKSRKNKTEL